MRFDWNIFITILSLLAVVVTWVAKILWARERDAARTEVLKAKDAQIETLKNELRSLGAQKDQTIEAKNAQIVTLQGELQTYRDLTPMKIREYTVSIKQQYEEMTEALESALNQAHHQINALNDKIEQQEIESDVRESELEVLKDARARLEERTHSLEGQLGEIKKQYDSSDILIRFPKFDMTRFANAVAEVNRTIVESINALAVSPTFRERLVASLNPKNQKALPPVESNDQDADEDDNSQKD